MYQISSVSRVLQEILQKNILVSFLLDTVVLDWVLGCRDISIFSWSTEWDLAIPVLEFRQQMAPLFSLIKLVLGIWSQLGGHSEVLWSSMPHATTDCDNIFQHFYDKCRFKYLTVLHETNLLQNLTAKVSVHFTKLTHRLLHSLVLQWLWVSYLHKCVYHQVSNICFNTGRRIVTLGSWKQDNLIFFVTLAVYNTPLIVGFIMASCCKPTKRLKITLKWQIK